MFLLVIGWPLSHVFNVIFYEPQLLAEDPMELFRVWGSISSYGGLFGGILAYFIWCYRNQDVERLKWGDVAITGIMLPWLFGRIGCASVHDHPGALAPDWFLAIDFPARINMAAGPRHDLGLYEAMWWVVIFAVMVWLDRKPRPRGFSSMSMLCQTRAHGSRFSPAAQPLISRCLGWSLNTCSKSSSAC